MEPMPAEPEKTGAGCPKGNAVWTAGEHFSPPHIDDRGERCHAGDVVHDDAAGKVKHTPFLQDATTPDHMDEGKVDENQPQGEKDQICLEGDPVGERAGNQCRCDDGEHHLISNMDVKRDTWGG